ncbi:MAG TPA: serine/threonine-protein kinase [Pirellulaceae bacterium]|nr:serine/threonine-protein kinase [Pirellulaceae bacterium]
MSDVSSKDLLEALRRSQLIGDTRLKQIVAECRPSADNKLPDLEQLSKFLLASGDVTAWQLDKLRAGKHRGFFLGQYKLLKLLGAGGMSTVYLAQHKLSGHHRAIKVLPKQRAADKSYLERFYREGRAAASLNHPHIVRIYDLASEGELHYMVMEYVDGMDLHQKIKREGPMNYDLALDCVRQAAEGLAQAHSQNIVHRDIKPANLLINAQGTVKILDLGLALMREETESLTLLHNERVMGTADFLAPEQALDSHNVDPRADIYSLGCTLYYLLTGHPPFPTGTIPQRIAAHQSREPSPIRLDRQDCPEPIAELVARMMRKKTEDRFQSCQEVVAAIRQLAKGRSELRISNLPSVATGVLGAEGTRTVESVRPQIKVRRKKSSVRTSYAVITLAVAVMFVLLVLLVYFFSG